MKGLACLSQLVGAQAGTRAKILVSLLSLAFSFGKDSFSLRKEDVFLRDSSNFVPAHYFKITQSAFSLGMKKDLFASGAFS